MGLFSERKLGLGLGNIKRALSRGFQRNRYSVAGPMGGSTTTYVKRGTTEYLQAVNLLPWLKAAVNVISSSVGAVDWDVMVPDSETGTPVQYAAKNKKPHDLDVFMYSPNPTANLSFSTLVSITNTYLEATGFTIWIMENETVGRMQAWPIPPHQILQTPYTDDPRYAISTSEGTKYYPMNEVIVFSTPDPMNPYGRGVGFVEALANDLGIEKASAEFILGFFEQDARPPIFITGVDMNAESAREFQNAWMREQSGSANKWKPYVASGDLKITTLTQDFQSMQILELRKFERDLIAEIFGIPPDKLGIVENSNRAIAEVADLTFSKNVLVPRLDFFKDVFQKQLIPFFDSDNQIMMEYASPVAEDKEYHLNVMRSNPVMYTQNQWLEKAGFESIGEVGDVYVVPMTYTTVENLGQLGGLPAPPSTGKEAYGDLQKKITQTIEEKTDISHFRKR